MAQGVTLTSNCESHLQATIGSPSGVRRRAYKPDRNRPCHRIRVGAKNSFMSGDQLDHSEPDEVHNEHHRKP